jgi:predicted alpha/beta-hydrolase family hydrolase
VTQTALAIPTSRGSIPALLLEPADAAWLIVLGHGAGAGMRHVFMQEIAERCAEHRIATLRYDYPYMAAGSRRPDAAPVLESVTRQVVQHAADTFPTLRIAAGGKSMGGRMTSRTQATAPLPRVEALVFFGFPLHPAGSPGTDRAAHLESVSVPMLFLQGTRDTLADLELMRAVTGRLGSRATLHIVDGADHGFAVLKRSGRSHTQVLDELAATTADWLARRAAGP